MKCTIVRDAKGLLEMKIKAETELEGIAIDQWRNENDLRSGLHLIIDSLPVEVAEI